MIQPPNAEGSTSDNRSRQLAQLCLMLAIMAAVALGVERLVEAPPLSQFFTKLILLVATMGTVVLSLSRRWVGGARTLEGVKNFALAASTLVVLALLGEFGLRVAYAGITTTGDNSSYWARRWNLAHVKQNHLGFREREIPAQPPAGVYRIAVIGDSFTFGQGIEAAERFTNRVEHLLNHDRKQFEVLNFGRPGAETIDEVEILKDVVLQQHPDFILLQWYVNDVEGHDKSGRPTELPLLPSETLREALHRHSVSYYVLDQKWATLQERLGWTKTYEDYMIARFGDSTSVGSREAAAMLADFVALCRKHNIPLGIVIFPSMDSHGQAVRTLDFLVERTLVFCERAGCDCLDLREALAQGGTAVTLTLNPFDGHPNGEANRIAAEAILKRFAPIWHRAAQDIPQSSSSASVIPAFIWTTP